MLRRVRYKIADGGTVVSLAVTTRPGGALQRRRRVTRKPSDVEELTPRGHPPSVKSLARPAPGMAPADRCHIVRHSARRTGRGNGHERDHA